MEKVKKTKEQRNTLHITEPERFAKMREAFEARGLGMLSLSAMVRIALDEWTVKQSS